MKMRLWKCIVGVAMSTVLPFPSSAHATEHTGYWNGPTPSGEAFECEGVGSRQRMVEVLRRAGWDMGARLPRIDWRRDKAVIVAPSRYYKSGQLAFYGLDREGNTIILRYGWERIRSTKVTQNSATFGSSREGYAAAIVVAYRRQLETGSRFVCRNFGLRN